MIRSNHNFAHVTTAELSWHVWNCDMDWIIWIKIEMKKDFSLQDFNFELINPLGNGSLSPSFQGGCLRTQYALPDKMHVGQVTSNGKGMKNGGHLDYNIDAWIQWLLFRGQHFQMHLLEWPSLPLDWNITGIRSYGSSWQYIWASQHWLR